MDGQRSLVGGVVQQRLSLHVDAPCGVVGRMAALKLFHWKYVDMLADWGPGQAVALAETKAKAIDLIVEGDHEWRRFELRAELERSEPEVHKEPHGFTI